jgi:phospholipid-translocating ATPase
MIFFTVTIPIYNGYLILGYSTIYTSLPVIALVLDEDVERSVCLRFPILYKSLQAGRYLNFKTFMIWVWKSMFQAAVIMFLAIILFHDSFLMIMSITYTTLIFIEFLNVYQEMTKAHRGMIVSIVFSIIFYGLSILCFNNLFQI